MSGLETAIRNALERSDRSSAETRARIYQSARQALETGLRKQDVSDPETLALQRRRLEETIRSIETEERYRLHLAQTSVEPDVGVADPVPDEVPEPVADIRGETRRPLPPAPDGSSDFDGMRAERLDRGTQPASAATISADRSEFTAGRNRPPRKGRRGFYSRLFVYSVLVAALGMAGWWVYTSGLLLTPEQRDTGVANPPATVQDEDFSGGETSVLKTLGPQSGFTDDWISVFKPGDIAKIATRSNSSVEAVALGDGQAVRITSRSVGDDGVIQIDIPPDILQALAGKRSTVALTLQSASDKPTQMSVECDFASLGECGRHRFTTTEEKTDALFQVTFDRSMAPSTAGHLMINSDLDGKGRAVNLFAVRILPGQ